MWYPNHDNTKIFNDTRVNEIMMNIRRLIAIWSGRLIKTACQITGKQGVTLAGKVALSIYPPILKELATEVRKDTFIVCGTNGKTTTNNLLSDFLVSNGNKVVCNHTGSNMLNGVVSAFVLSARLNGHLDADYACIEIDEASTVRVLPHFKPDYMVLTNLFRDQLDRYGEIDITMNLLSRAMKMAPNMKLLVNADDSFLLIWQWIIKIHIPLTESANRYSKTRIPKKSVKVVSVNAVVTKWNTNFIITASSGIITVRNVDSNVQNRNLMLPTLICPTDSLLM